MDLETYRKIGQNAAKYVKGEKVTPVECTNDPMVRAKYQVKAALMHIVETAVSYTHLIDTDEANAAKIATGNTVTIIK